VDGQMVSALASTITNHQQKLHLENALFERETTFDIKGKAVTVNSARFLSIENPNLGVIKYSFTCNQQAHVKIKTGIDYNIWDLNGPHLVDIKTDKTGQTLVFEGTASETGKKVAVAEVAKIGFGKELHEISGKKNLRVIELEAEAGKTYTFYKYFTVFTSNDPMTLTVTESAKNAALESQIVGYEKSLQHHNAEWGKRWNACDVILEGDDEAQLALRYSIFQLLIVAPVKGSGNSIPARALSGQVYKGAIFWIPKCSCSRSLCTPIPKRL
jgi:kojibiose phosphorylase